MSWTTHVVDWAVTDFENFPPGWVVAALKSFATYGTCPYGKGFSTSQPPGCELHLEDPYSGERHIFVMIYLERPNGDPVLSVVKWEN